MAGIHFCTIKQSSPANRLPLSAPRNRKSSPARPYSITKCQFWQHSSRRPTRTNGGSATGTRWAPAGQDERRGRRQLLVFCDGRRPAAAGAPPRSLQAFAALERNTRSKRRRPPLARRSHSINTPKLYIRISQRTVRTFWGKEWGSFKSKNEVVIEKERSCRAKDTRYVPSLKRVMYYVEVLRKWINWHTSRTKSHEIC